MDGLAGRFAAGFCALALLATPARGNGAYSEDVPFITTPDNVTLAMLRLAGVSSRDYLIDLGSGDGRIVITAARIFGARGLGVEIVPDLVKRSRENARRAGVEDRAQFLEQDLFKTDLAPASVVTLYLLPEVNLQLRPRILALRPGTRVVSHDWDMGEWEPDRTLTLPVPDKKVGVEKSSRVHFWTVPARLTGAWCGEPKQRVTLVQAYQKARAILAGVPFDLRIEGAIARTAAGDASSLVLHLEGDTLQVSEARGAAAALAGAQLRRCNG